MKKLLFIFNFRTFCHFCALQAQSVAGSLKQSYLYCLLMMAMFLPQVVSAAVVYWTGTTNSDWNTASNWTTGILPTSADDVYIHAGSTPDPVISSGTITVRSVQVRVRSLTVNSGATLRIIGDAGSAFAIFMMTDASSVVNNGTIALEASTGGPTTGWMIPSATTTFTNNGTLRINTTFQTAIEAGHNLNNIGQATGLCTINNSACGKIILTAGNFMIYANTVSNVTNAGLIQVTANINGFGNFTNQSGGVSIRGGGYQAITNNNGSIIVNNNPTNSTIFTYTGTFTGTVNGIYTDSAGTISAGTFTAPNTFAPSGLPTGAQTLYAKITPSGGACSYVVPFTYTMIAAPSITTQPTSGSTCAGSSRTFTVAASNAPTYQWQVSTGGSFTNLSNTSPYSNVTGASLNISNVAGLNGYQYRCIATNDGGSATSNPATLTVNTAPTITTQPTAQTTCAGSSVSFSVAATGTGLSYQWKKGTTNVGTNSATYTIASPVVGDAGNYSVVVSGTCGSPETSNSVALTVNPFALRAYVNGAVASSGDGTSWATAVKTIEEGMNVCGAEEVWVATGTYKPTKDPFGNTNPTDPRDKTFYIKDGIEIYGGFAGTETLLSQRNITANTTTLSGDFDDDDVVTGSGSSLTITGNGENAYHVVLASTTVSGAGVTIDGFSIIGGHANGSGPVSVNGNNINRSHGGGILAYRGTNTLTNNILSGNSANSYPNDAGGGICAFYGTNTITNNILSKNRASYFGGGICTFYGTNTITDNNLSGNRANTNGGGIGTFIGSNNTLANNTLSGNSAGYGGGIYTNNSTNTLTNNTLLGNSASEGGGIYIDISTNTLTNNTLSGNSSGNGGGIYIGNGTNTLTNNTLSGNSSGNGGGIYIGNGTNTLTNNTLSGNWAGNGGGVYTNNGTNAFINNIFWGNKKGTNANILAADYFATNTNSNIFTNNLFQLATSNYPTDASLPYGIGTGASGNIFATDPLFVDAADIDGADNIHRTTDDGLLLSTCSPAINVGTNTNAPTTDILGNAIYSSLKDMGAYELQANPSIVPAITTQPTAQTTCAGSSVSFSVAATGTGLSYQWKKGAANVGTNSATYTIVSPVVGDAGNYSVVVSGTCGSPITSNSVALTVNTAPSITTQPTAQTTCAGSSVSFSVAATGTSLSYQWKKGTTNVGTNSATYTIASPVIGDAGNYSVVVSGTCGSPETSNSVALTVNTVQSITTQPTAQTTCVGSSVSFSVAATGTGLSYQWKKGTTNVGTNSATYTIASPVVGDAGNYSVVVSGTCGSPETSNSVALTVNTAPTITTQPTAQTTCAGSSVSFSVAATGTGLSYQWKKGTTNVGTNSATYTIASPVVGDTGNYNVVLSGTCGSPVTSNSVALTVNTAPSITTQPAAQTTCAGSSVSFSVAATGTSLSYQWKKGTTNVGTNSATYTIASPVAGDTGSYSVVVSGTCGSSVTSNSVALMVNTAPVITTQLTAQTTCAGSSVSFSVAATGTGLSYQWKKGSTNVGTNSATYTIPSPVVGDAGNYSVVVSGTCTPSLTSNIVLLNVNPAPNASITYPTTLCSSASATSVQLSGSNTGTYSASPAGLNIDTNTGTITPSSSALGAYTITYTIPANGNCASFTTTSTVNIATVPPAPSISASSNNVCAGTPVTLTASPAASYTASEYLWYKNGTAINWGYSPTFTVGTTNAGTDIYSVEIVYLGYACISAQSASNTIIKNSPNATITPNGATTFCANNPTSLSIPTGMNSYIWKRGNTIVNIGSSTYIPTASGNHSVKVTDVNGCSKTSPSVNININPLPIANAGADKSVCVGEGVQIGANNNTANSYAWSPAATLSNAATAYPIALPLGTTNYTLTVTNNTTGCSKTDIVVVTIKSLPVTPAISSTIVGANTILTVNNSGANAVNWYKNGFMYLSNQVSNGSITVPITNTSNAYACKSIGANGCLSSFSNAINARQGDEKDGDSLIEINDNTMSVYPNPTSGNLNIEISDTHATNGMLYLHNAVGQVVFAQNIELLNGFTREILDLQSLAAGIYTLTFQTDSGNIVHKIVKD